MPLMSFAFRIALLILLCVLVSAPVHALVHLPTGEYRETVEDLRIKVHNGHVVLARTWQADDLNKGLYRWHPNPAWDDLTFTMDVIDGVPKTIHRAGARFERTGNDVYVYNRQYFLRAVLNAQSQPIGWRWSDRLGNWITYTAEGRITAYGDRNGLTVSFVRDPQQRVAELHDANNALILTYTWTNGRLTALTDRAGRSVAYHYTGDHLTAVTDVLGHTWTYGYTGSLLTTRTDPLNRTTTIAYNGNRAVRVTDAAGHQTNYAYAYDRVKREYTVVLHTPQNRRTERRYDADGRVRFEQVGDRITGQLVKDGNFVEIATDARGGITRTEFDANRNPIKVTFPDGTSTKSKYDGTYRNLLEHTDARGIQSTYAYDAVGRLVQQTDAAGTPQQRLATYTYNTQGQRVTQTIHGASPADDATTTYTYDAHGNITSIADPENRTTSFTHHVTGAVLTRTDPRGFVWTSQTNAAGWITATADPLGHTRTTAYDAVGNRTAVTDALNHTTTYDYDLLDRVLKTTDPLGHSTTITYSPDGQRLTETDQTGATATFGYDSDGRLTSITDPAGNVTALEYGAEGSGLADLLVARQFPTYREEYKADPRGRLTQIIQVLPGNPETRLTRTIGYDGASNINAEINPAGHAMLYRYDALSRLIETVDTEAGTTVYGYDVRDHLTTVTDANGNTHTFTYDNAGQVKTETRPMGATIAYAYDPTGNLIQRTSPNGERHQFDYDAAGRRTAERQYPKESDTPTQTVAYTYDARNALTAYIQTGDTASSAVYTYDARGQKISEAVTYGEGDAAFSHTTHTAYRPNGQKQSFAYPDNTQVAYTYTANGLLKTAGLPNADDITWATYQWQQPTRIVLSGVVRTIDYDALQRPTRIKSQAIGAGTVEAPAGADIMDYRYTFDAASNITARETEDGLYTYAYDVIDRLTHAIPPLPLQHPPGDPQPGKLPVEAYSYDSVYNRQSSQHQPGAWTYNADNQLTGYGTGLDQRTHIYNANGHTAQEITGDPQTPSHTRDFLYNTAERLAQVKDNGLLIGSYHYDPMGRRIRKQTQAETSWFLYSDEGLIAELSADGIPERYYGWKPDGLWGTDPLWLAEKPAQTWITHTYQNDHLWTPQRLTDAEGQVQWAAISEAFGKTSVTLGTVDSPLRFPGQYFDAESGLHYNYFRDYDPSTGRYSQSDPIGLLGGINTYRYAEANPLMFTDSYGLFGMADMPTAPQWAEDFGAGLGDVLTFGITGAIRKQFDIGSVNECSTAYTAGEVTGVVGSIATGFAGGTKAVARASSPNNWSNFSHSGTPAKWNRGSWWSRPGNRANGDYLPTTGKRPDLHDLMDAKAARVAGKYPTWPAWRRLPNRMPYTPGAALYGGASATMNACGCEK